MKAHVEGYKALIRGGVPALRSTLRAPRDVIVKVAEGGLEDHLRVWRGAALSAVLQAQTPPPLSAYARGRMLWTQADDPQRAVFDRKGVDAARQQLSLSTDLTHIGPRQCLLSQINYLVEGDTPTTRRHCEAAIEASEPLGFTILGELAEMKRDIVSAKSYYEKGLASDDPSAHFHMGHLLLVAEKDLKSSIPFFEEAAALGKVEAHFSIGNLYLKLNQRPEAIRSYVRAMIYRNVHARGQLKSLGLQDKEIERLHAQILTEEIPQ